MRTYNRRERSRIITATTDNGGRNMKRIAIVLTLIACPLFAADNIAGRWEGTSICTKVEGNESCRDETVRYDIAPSQSTKGGMAMDAQKLVNGEYQSMGIIDLTWNAKAKRWESRFKTRRGQSLWAFEVKGDRIIGTCVLLPDTVLRHAEARRVVAPR
jgi:hypothetical protein